MDSSKLIFLGTAGDTTTVNKQLRHSGGIIFHYGNNQIHLDPGPGSLAQYRNAKLNPRNTIALVATNNSLRACGELNAVVSAMTHDGMDNRGVLIASRSIIQGTENENPILWKRYQSYLERNIALSVGERVGINEVNFHALNSKNNDPTSFALRIQTPMYSITYTSDTMYQQNIVSQYENTDILIVNCENHYSDQKNQRLNLTEVTRIINEIYPNLVILTGFGVKMLDADPVFTAREVQRETGVQVIAAYDGLEINPSQYKGTHTQY